MIVLYVILGAILLYILFLVICALAVDTKREYSDFNRFYRRVLNDFTALGLWVIRVRVHASGVEKLPKNTKVLFVSNHRSNFDPIVTWHALKPWNIAFVSKEANFHIPVLGRIIRRCAFHAIDRENPRNAIKTINEMASILEKGEMAVGVYPEGTRNRQKDLLPLHNGVFKIAQKANAPIAILSISGTEQIHKNYPLHRTHVYLDVLQVIPAETVCRSKTEAIGKEFSELVLNALKEREPV